MLPALPARPRPLARLARLAALAAACLVGAAGAALAFGVELSETRVRAGGLWAEVRLAEVLPARVEESLARGMPARLALRGELWRSRSGWFDRLEEGVDAELRLRYEVWSREFLIERRGVATERYPNLDSLRAALARPFALRVAGAERLQPGGRYYVAIAVTLQPLSVEDVEEVEGWLSGEVDTKRRAGLGVLTELPRALFDTVRNFSGFGDLRARVISRRFAPADVAGR